ncbi:hypothetical protein H8959_003410 [Pygathrix nigripes]
MLERGGACRGLGFSRGSGFRTEVWGEKGFRDDLGFRHRRTEGSQAGLAFQAGKRRRRLRLGGPALVRKYDSQGTKNPQGTRPRRAGRDHREAVGRRVNQPSGRQVSSAARTSAWDQSSEWDTWPCGQTSVTWGLCRKGHMLPDSGSELEWGPGWVKSDSRKGGRSSDGQKWAQPGRSRVGGSETCRRAWTWWAKEGRDWRVALGTLVTRLGIGLAETGTQVEGLLGLRGLELLQEGTESQQARRGEGPLRQQGPGAAVERDGESVNRKGSLLGRQIERVPGAASLSRGWGLRERGGAGWGGEEDTDLTTPRGRGFRPGPQPPPSRQEEAGGGEVAAPAAAAVSQVLGCSRAAGLALRREHRRLGRQRRRRRAPHAPHPLKVGPLGRGGSVDRQRPAGRRKDARTEAQGVRPRAEESFVGEEAPSERLRQSRVGLGAAEPPARAAQALGTRGGAGRERLGAALEKCSFRSRSLCVCVWPGGAWLPASVRAWGPQVGGGGWCARVGDPTPVPVLSAPG